MAVFFISSSSGCLVEVPSRDFCALFCFLPTVNATNIRINRCVNCTDLLVAKMISANDLCYRCSRKKKRVQHWSCVQKAKDRREIVYRYKINRTIDISCNKCNLVNSSKVATLIIKRYTVRYTHVINNIRCFFSYPSCASSKRTMYNLSPILTHIIIKNINYICVYGKREREGRGRFSM